MTYRDHNLGKINELLEPLRWPVTQFMDECSQLGLDFRISEAFRTQARQDSLYAQGRTTKGPIRTWTRHSQHTKRVAIDLYPVKYLNNADQLRKLAQIASIAGKYGIVRPPELLKLGDYGHFDCSNAKAFVVKPKSGAERLAALERRYLRAKNEAKRKAMLEEINQLRLTLSLPPISHAERI